MKDYLNYLKSFSRYNCPNEHYCAWKIFVLKTEEYNIDKMCDEFKYSYERWLEEQNAK